MKMLIINAGSSSLKFKLYEIQKGEEVLIQGMADGIGLNDSFITYCIKNQSSELRHAIENHKEALRLVTLVITQKEYVAERWEPGEVAVPGEPKRIVVPVKLRVSPAELARSLMILSDLQRRGAGIGPWGELPDLVAAEQAVPLDTEDRPMTWSVHVLSMKIGDLSEELANARMEIERRDAEIARLKAKAGEA
jgi:hypothetical protein